jgi:hypothetical protein
MKINDKQRIDELEKELWNYKNATVFLLIGLIASLIVLGLIASSNHKFEQENQQLKDKIAKGVDLREVTQLEVRDGLISFWTNYSGSWKNYHFIIGKINDTWFHINDFDVYINGVKEPVYCKYGNWMGHCYTQKEELVYLNKGCLDKGDLEYWYNDGKGWKLEDVNKTKLNETIRCIKQEIIENE